MIELNGTIKGKMNGHRFVGKPKSLLARKVDKELREDLKEWQEKNNAEYVKWSKEHSQEIEEALNNNDYGADVFKDAPQSNDWLDDVEFRSKRFKKMADASMEFKDDVPAKLWKSDELEYGVIEVAWDFFTGTRQLPKNMLIS